jgi:subtilisin family serine protease
MKRMLELMAMLCIMAGCTKADIQQQPTQIQTEQSVTNVESLDKIIFQQLQRQGYFDWNEMTVDILWSAMELSNDYTVSVGFKPVSEESIKGRIHKIDLNADEWVTAKRQLLQEVLASERRTLHSLREEDILRWKEEKLPVVNLFIRNKATLQMLRESELVRYVEPMGFDPISRNEKTSSGGSGCGGYTPDNDLRNGKDYLTISPNAKQSWNYDDHGIPEAWTRTTGAGIKIMVIDTGMDPDQNNMNSDFNQGASSGRTIEKITTFPNASNVNDFCGHGTVMAGAATAPRCTDGNAVGVAYNSSLVSCKANTDVYIDDGAEVKAVADAYTWAADNASVRIISLSNGRLTRSGQITDAIEYAYGKGKLMFCAAGTSTSITAIFYGVIFPATLPEVNAITGVEERQSGLYRCDACHSGGAVDFVIVMEQKNTNLHGLAPAIYGDQPTTVGGSSVATATAAGIAALVWSRYPTWTRDQVQQRLTTTASTYPKKKLNLGYGKLDADLATR